MDSADVLCLGETMVMVTPEVPVPLESAPLCVLRPGGAESNVAMFLASLGHRARWVSRVGDDPMGRLVVGAVHRTGVDIGLVETAAGEQTGVYFKDPSPEGTRVYYYRRSSAASGMGPDVVSRLREHPVRAVHVTGITAALSATCAALINEIVVERALPGALVSFDVNYRAGLWSPEQAAPMLLRLAEAADLVFVGLDEASTLWGTTTADDVRRVVAAPQRLIVKDAARDAVAFTPEGTTRVPALEVDVVEAVGAGDAFAAGWLSGWLRRLDPRSGLRLGHLMAAVAMSSTADHGVVPSPAELAAHLTVDDDAWARLRPRPAAFPDAADQ